MAHDDNKENKANTIRFVYKKTRHHRTFHPDGAWASLTPQLEIQFALFKDLKAMPDAVTHHFSEDGTLGEEIKEDEPQSVLREVDATIVMNKDAVKSLIELLGRMVDQAETHIADHVAKIKAKAIVDGETEKVS